MISSVMKDINLEDNIKNEVLDMSSSLKVFLNKFFGKENVDELVNNITFNDNELESISDVFFTNYKSNESILSKDVLVDLEIFEGIGNNKEENIYKFIDNCKTFMGKYLLKKILQNPISDTKKLIFRQEFIKKVYNDDTLYNQLSNKLIKISQKEKQLVWLWKTLNE